MRSDGLLAKLLYLLWRFSGRTWAIWKKHELLFFCPKTPKILFLLHKDELKEKERQRETGRLAKIDIDRKRERERETEKKRKKERKRTHGHD